MKTARFSTEVARALNTGGALVALETAVVTHGLPRPVNIRLARDMEEEIRRAGAVPATVGVLDGVVRIGMSAGEIQQLAEADPVVKISRRDFAGAIARRQSGGTTVAGTMTAVDGTGIHVFATGGIGGVHRGAPFDISADLPVLGQISLVVVCAGAKSILDLPATLEVLETLSVPVVGFQTEEFPAFYARSSGLPVSVTAGDAREAAAIARAHWEMGNRSAVLVVVPPPVESALPEEDMERAVDDALAEAEKKGVRGQAVTPFLLEKVAQLTGEASLKANLALLLQNGRVAAEIAREL